VLITALSGPWSRIGANIWPNLVIISTLVKQIQILENFEKKSKKISKNEVSPNPVNYPLHMEWGPGKCNVCPFNTQKTIQRSFNLGKRGQLSPRCIRSGPQACTGVRLDLESLNK